MILGKAVKHRVHREHRGIKEFGNDRVRCFTFYKIIKIRYLIYESKFR
jgi:hypothetical protein